MKIHMIGVGGVGMSGLARLLVSRGDEVTGSDLVRTPLSDQLDFPVSIGHDASHLGEAQMAVRSAAIPDDNVEVVAAQEKGLPVVKYSEYLATFMEGRIGIAVAGCHGKSTTAGMIAYILERAGFEPGYVIGGVIPQLGGNAEIGKGAPFVAEACEFDRSFLALRPNCSVITNIEEDHLDYYKDIEEISAAFQSYASNASEIVIGSIDNPRTAAIVTDRKGTDEGYSIENEADWRANNIEIRDGVWTFEVLKYGRSLGEFELAIPGHHNVSNALAAIAATSWAGVGHEIIQLALAEFTGVERRFQVLGEYNGAVVVDDYGHHPTEIQATLKAAKERYPKRKIWCVFQPHQYSRTKIFANEFARSFNDAALVLLPEVYEAREGKKGSGVSSSDLARLLDKNGKAALFLPNFEDVVSFLRKKATEECLILTMGAGNVDEIARKVLAK